jgi:hypothetical protein
MNSFTMVVPTYWGQARSGFDTRTEIVFDHPTSLDSPGTLARLLDSLDILDRAPDTIVIIAVANRSRIVAEVEAKVNQIIAPYRSRREILLLGHTALNNVKEKLAAKGVSSESLSIVNLDNYAGVRNICSLAGILNAAASAAAPCTTFIDDDELFTDSKFFDKLSNVVGTTHNADTISRSHDGQTISALAGYYLQPDTYRLDESKVPLWRAQHWNTAAAMNHAFDLIIGEGPRLKPTPFVFGGNMTITLDALTQTPFDPRITRGEDIDFLLNLRIHTTTFFLDRQLPIKHLAPAHSQPFWKRFREDAVRFLYERKKITDHQLPLADLQPYPGTFLGPDLEHRIIRTAELLKRHYQAEHDHECATQCDAIIALAHNNPFARFDTCSWLDEITARWREVTSAAIGLGIPH